MKRRLTSVVAQLILVLGGTLGVSLVLSRVAVAAPDYPSNYCTFSQASKTTISAECRDDQANGGFDGKNFTSKPASPTKYTLTEKSQGTVKVVDRSNTTWTGKALSCTATITARDTGEATITGSYLKSKVVVDRPGDGSRTEYECAALLEGPVGLKRDEARLDAWVKAYISATTDDLTSECAGNPDTVTACKSAVPSAVSKCMDKGSDAYAALDNFLLLTDERKKDVYIDKASACLSDALKGVTGFSLSPADVIRIVQGNKAKADEAAGKIADSPAPPSPEPEGGEDATEPVCSAGALGWVICPAINFISDANDAIYGAVQSMLIVQPLTLKTGESLYQVWTKFRDLANIAFVIAFLVVIFSQATSVGLSSYGIKKMLPRIIVAAILVNLSFFICQIAVDLSNIVGTGLASFVSGFRSGEKLDIDWLSWSGVISAIIGGGAVYAGVSVVLAAGGIAAAMAMVLPFLVTALFAVITAIAILVARQVIIILLVVLSPLAFVAFILPNTQKYFQLWQNTFTTMLVMFPLVSLLFAGSQLAANIVLTTSASDDGISVFALIAAVSMLFLPLFGVPYIVKFSGGLLGRVAGVVNNPNKGPFDALRKRAEDYRDYKQHDARARVLKDLKNNPIKGPNRFGSIRGFRRSAAKRVDREAVYASAQERENDAKTAYIGSKLAPDKSTGKASDERFAQQMAGGSDIRALTRAMARGVQAADDLEIKELKAAQVLLQNARLDAQGLESALKGHDVRGMNGQVLKGGEMMQMAAGAMMMSQGRQMDLVAKTLGSGDATEEMRNFVVGQIQSNFNNAKERQVGLTDEAFQRKIIEGNFAGANTATYEYELTKSTGKKAADLTPDKLVSQEKTSSEKIEFFINGPGAGSAEATRIKDIARKAWGANGKNTTMARANDDTASVIERII